MDWIWELEVELGMANEVRTSLLSLLLVERNFLGIPLKNNVILVGSY